MHANSFINSRADETTECLENSYVSTTRISSILYYYKMQMPSQPLHTKINLLFSALLQKASPPPHRSHCSTGRMVLIYTAVFNTDAVIYDHFLPMNWKLDEFEMTLHTK